MNKDNDFNAGVSHSRIKFCDMRCEFASFPKTSDVDGARSCKTYLAIWCKKLERYVTKNAPCVVIFGERRPKISW